MFLTPSLNEDNLYQYLSPVEVTRRVLDGALQEVLTFLTLTTEVGDEEGWLHTLDLSLRMEGNNMVRWKYYEKPTTTNVTVQRRSALEENSKMQILSNDLVRRLASTDGKQGRKVICAVIDQITYKWVQLGTSPQDNIEWYKEVGTQEGKS